MASGVSTGGFGSHPVAFEECRIMPEADGGFEQCYNAQAIVAAEAVQAPNDKQQLTPMLGKLADLPVELAKAETLLADNGYFSE